MFWYILAGLPILLLLRRVLRKRSLGSLANKPSQEPPIVTTKNGQVGYLKSKRQNDSGNLHVDKIDMHLFQQPSQSHFTDSISPITLPKH